MTTDAVTTDAVTAAAGVRLRPMRWWDIEDCMVLEHELFPGEAWTRGLFWSELAEADSRHYFVAVDGDELVGYAGLCAYAHEAYVQTLAVRPDHQGRGLGRALLEALLAEADRRGLPAVALEVRADNARAQRLYAAYGFEAVGLRRGYYQPSGADAVVMVRRSG